MDNTPAAAQPTEAIPQTTDTKPVADATSGSTPEMTNELNSEQVANFLGTNTETLERFQKFIEANGKFDKAFEKMRSGISNPQQGNPQKTVEPQTAAARTEPEQSQPQPAPQPTHPPKGFASLNELNVERYFKDLATDPKYASISEQIANGEVLKEMSAMGMNPIDENYNINVNQLNQFLTLKAASVPTKPTSVEPTNIPTVDYVEVGENITDMNQALTVMQQSMEAQAKGAAPHPALAQAKEFLAKNWSKK